MNTEVPREISNNILNAIKGALEEEKTPRSKRLLKVMMASFLSVVLLSLPLFFVFREEVTIAWYLAAFFWWILFTVGFYLHYSPQPRLEVAGYWSPFILARLLIVSAILTGLEIILCPSFVFLESPVTWSPFEELTSWFMSLGGMRACMFICGFLFSSIGGLISFSIVAKTLSGGRFKSLIRPILVLFCTQIPVFFIQAWDVSLRPFLPFWILGCLSGIAVALFAIRSVSMRIRSQ